MLSGVVFGHMWVKSEVKCPDGSDSEPPPLNDKLQTLDGHIVCLSTSAWCSWGCPGTAT